MASNSKQLQAPTLLLVAVLLFLVLACATRVQAARPEPRSKDHMPQAELAVSAAAVVGDEKSGSGPGMETHQAEPDEGMKECEGEEEGEECLMRRTLVAHTDYIYTQGKHN